MNSRTSSRKSSSPDRAATLTVRIQPRASRNGIQALEDGSWKIRLTAPPVDGAANEALVKYLSETLEVAKTQVAIVSGHTGRQKIIRIEGLTKEAVTALLKEAGK